MYHLLNGSFLAYFLWSHHHSHTQVLTNLNHILAGSFVFHNAPNLSKSKQRVVPEPHQKAGVKSEVGNENYFPV